MVVYAANLIVGYVSSLVARTGLLLPRPGRWRGTIRWGPVVIACASLTLVAGLRYHVGTDYGAYVALYSHSTEPVDLAVERDIGFAALCRLLHVFSSDPQLLFVVAAAVTTIGVVLGLRAYGRPFELAMFMYIGTYAYYSSFNGVRQSMAMAIYFGGSRFLLTGRFWHWLMLVVIASTLHMPALVMLPAYFLVRGPTFSLRHLLLIVLALGLTIGYVEFMPTVLRAVAWTPRFAPYPVSVFEEGLGAHPLRLAVFMLPVLVSWAVHRRLVAMDGRTADILCNLNLLAVLCMLLAVRHWVFARVAGYFAMYVMLLVPRLTRVFGRGMNQIAYAMVVVCYLAFSTALLMANESAVLPYRTIFERP
jgi:transmembrane protein EpsG